MEHYPDSSSDTMRDKVEVVIRGLNAIAALNTAEKYPNLTPDVYGCDFVGKKYWRVYYTMSNTQRMVAFFVQIDNGDLWKAAGWKAPALNFTRGNIATKEGRSALYAQKLGSRYGGF